MKKILLSFIVIVGIVFIAGCIGGEKSTDTKTSTDASGVSTPSQQNIGQETNQINIDRNDPILAQRINRLEMGGKALIPIANPTKEIQIGNSVYITGLTINDKVSGFIENRGEKSLQVDIGKFSLFTKDYIFSTELPVIYINGQRGASLWFESGQKKSFSTINTKDANEYKKLGGIPEELTKLDQLVTQSSYLQIVDFSVSDT